MKDLDDRPSVCRSLVFSQDGKTLVAGTLGQPSAITLWATDGWKKIRSI